MNASVIAVSISLLVKIIIAKEDINFQNRTVEYKDGSTVLKGYLAYNSFSSLRPAVVIVHDWNGRDEFESAKADDLANLGYVAFALDLFGSVGRDPTENQKLIKPFRDSKQLLLRRLQLGLDEVKKLTFVDQNKVNLQILSINKQKKFILYSYVLHVSLDRCNWILLWWECSFGNGSQWNETCWCC